MTTIISIMMVVLAGHASRGDEQLVRSRDGACQISVPGAWKVTPMFSSAASPDNKVSVTVGSPKMVDSFSDLKKNARTVYKASRPTKDSATEFEMEGSSIAGKPDVYRAIPAGGGKYCITEVIYENGAVDAARGIARSLKATKP